MRVLSGIQPSGNLHLGNYFGMMKRMVDYQDHHELYCFIVNYHALTTLQDAKALRTQTLYAAADFLALGLDPKKAVFWVQSDVPEVTELAWILSNLTGMGLLERCHSYKDKIAQGLKPHHGLFAYPVLMAADILIMGGERVPVGNDQKQHLEVAQDIAEKFNRVYGEIMTVPEPDICAEAGILSGTDGRKMSKSYGNTIEIFCDEKTLRSRVMGIKTDSTPVDEPKPVKNNPLYEIYAAFLDETGRAELRRRFEAPGLKYGDVKKELVEVIRNYFEPFRKRREALVQDESVVLAILREGAERARATAHRTMQKIRKVVGIDYRS
ncbi:MAG: tryptophan--tRNA ligase [Candidatus Omnitrophica bacterium]|nr:tryptophan--tRNA ligase [Candidatus Omnitrophota bacterium]